MQPTEHKIDPARIYSPEDAAELFQVAPGTIRRLIRQRSIDTFRVGNQTRMTGLAVIAFVDAGGARIDNSTADDAESDSAESALDRIAAAADGVTVPDELILT